MKFKNKTIRFLAASLGLVAAVCVCVLTLLALYMSKQSTHTISEVGTFYMSSMSQQISMHFETTIGLRLGQLDVLSRTISSESIHTDREEQLELIHNAQAREFSHLAFYYADGRFEMLYGQDLEVTDPAPFLDSLLGGDKKVAIGTQADGEKVVLMGVPAVHPPTEAHPCVALVAALPVSYISDTLSLDENAEHVYSFIIRQDGSFVIRTADALSNSSYFERVRTLYEDVDGKNPEQYLTELQDAMSRDEEYSTEFSIYGELRHLYCTRLAYSEWYLITFMPYRTMDSIVRGLNQRWITAALVGGGIIFLSLLAVLFAYLWLSHQQLNALTRARQEAENARLLAEHALEAAEKARREAEHANKAKSEFLSNMSHDIRTPMNAVVGMTAIATANIDDKDQVQNCLKKISLSSKHLLGLINDVLDMSKIESGKLTLNIDQVSLREVMDSIVNIVQPQIKAKNQRFDVLISDISVENVYCDSVRLNQVLLNFLSNAIKFTPDGGTIRLSLYEEPSPKGDGFIRIHLRVKDNGIGIAPDFKDKIFDSFTRADSTRVHKTEGTGLGMAITKYIVDAMEGAIEVDSELGKGSEFHVTLDLEQAEIQEEDMVLPDWNMLVVDDDRQLCESTVAALKSIGIRAEWTLDGESAVTMVEERHAKHDDYHIILLDWKLPGIDGIETARQIRQHLEEQPILLISAYDWGEIERDARDAGVTGFIGKPLFKSTLFHGLRPFAEPAEQKEPDRAPGAHVLGDFTGVRVLLAEDNDLNWEIADELLSDLNLTLDRAENGQVCLDKFLASPEDHYDVILMDLRMPVMNGYEATQAIRALPRPDAWHIPIIAMTADAFSEDIKKCLDCGMNAHTSKPIDVREISRLLEKFLFSGDT